MILRERKDTISRMPTFRKDPLHEVEFLADISQSIREGSISEKIGAMMRLSARIERGGAPLAETSDLLCEALKDPERSVKWNAVIIMARHGSDFLPGLCSGLSNDDPHVRVMSAAIIRSSVCLEPSAFTALGEMEHDMAGELLRALERGDPELATTVFEALVEVAERNPLLVLGWRGRPSDLRTEWMLGEIERTAVGSLRKRSGETC
jgi:HEAT repeat protein